MSNEKLPAQETVSSWAGSEGGQIFSHFCYWDTAPRGGEASPEEGGGILFDKVLALL
jgi:hypothetical protein